MRSLRKKREQAEVVRAEGRRNCGGAGVREGVARDLGGGAVRTKAAIHNAVTYVFHEIKKSYQPTLDRFAELSAAMEHELTLGSLRRAHADYDTVIGEVEKWVDTLPAAYKAGAKDVLEQGTRKKSRGSSANTSTPRRRLLYACSEGTPDANLRGSEEGSREAQNGGFETHHRSTAADPNSFEGWVE